MGNIQNFYHNDTFSASSNGSIGINTTDPVTAAVGLTLDGATPFVGFTTQADYDATVSRFTRMISDGNSINFFVSNTTNGTYAAPLLSLNYVANDGIKMGVGLSNPEELLHIKAINKTATIEIQGGLNSITAVDQVHSEINFGTNDASATGGIAGSIKSVAEYSNGAYAGLAFYTCRQGRTPPLELAMQIRNTGAIAFGSNTEDYGSAGEILVSNGNASPTWDAASTVIGGPYLPLAGGTMTGVAGVVFPDAFKLKLGTGSDLQISHDAFDSYINNFTGNLNIVNLANDKDIIFQSDDGLGGTTEYFRVDGGESNTIFSRDLKFLDSGLTSRKAIFGTGDDLQIYHDASNSYIKNNGGDLYIQQNTNDGDIILQSDNGSGGSENYIQIDGSEGRTTFNKNIRLNDNVQAQFGSSADLKIYHDGSGTYMENGTGNMYIMQRQNDGDMVFQCDNGSGGDETYFYLDGSLGLNRFLKDTLHNDDVVAKFGTGSDLRIQHSSGNNSSYIQNYTGDLIIENLADDKDIIFRSDDASGGVTTYLQLDGSHTQSIAWKDIHFVDGIKAKFGDYASPDLQIYHDASNSYINDTGTGDLYIQASDNMYFQTYGSGKRWITLTENAAVDLFYNDSKKFETTSAGVAVTGSLSTTEDISVAGDLAVTGTTTAGGTLICEGNITVQDSDKLQLGNSQDLELYHSSGVSYIDNDTGHLYIRNNVDNDDGSNIYIQAKSGENSILCQDDGAVGLYNNNIQKFSTNSTGAGAYGYIGFGSAGTSTGSSYGFRYGSSSPGNPQGIAISVSDTGGSYFNGVGKFQNTNTGSGAGMFQMINYGSSYSRYMQFFRGSTSNIIGYIGYNASNTSVTFSTTNSDIRTKKNITTWDENVLDKFKALQPKRFDFKVAIGDKGAVKERGFIAQYEKDNFPEAYQLNGNDERATYGFHPMEMVPYMMKAIKDLTVKNEELERRIKTLES